MSSNLPALLGGPPAFPELPPSWPILDDDVLRALQTIYADGSWGKYHGGSVERLEERLSQYHGVEFAVTCASGTFAVELALRALKIGPGDEVIMSAYDYGGNFLCVHAVGAHPVLVDVAANNWNLDPEQLEAAIGPATRAIIASHLHGGVVPMREVMEIAGRRGLSVIEDAAQMPGAVIQGRKAGTWGDVGVLSFGGSKLLTAGRGGAVLTNRKAVCQRIRIIMLRGNLVCPLSELQAAVLLPQLDKLDARNTFRAQNVEILDSHLRSISGLRRLMNATSEMQPGYYKVGFQFDAAQFGISRLLFKLALGMEGISLDDGFKALHVGRSPNRFRASGALTEATRAHEGILVLHHPILLAPHDQMETFASGIDKVYANVHLLRRHD